MDEIRGSKDGFPTNGGKKVVVAEFGKRFGFHMWTICDLGNGMQSTQL